jgi:sarcosine oxidase
VSSYPLSSRSGRQFANRFNTIVVGVGGMGSATAYYLARRGQRVLGLERYDIPHDQGSSHGYTRIIRLAYYEHPSYVMLLRRAYELWRELEARREEQLLHITGSIDAGPADSWVFKGSLRSCVEHELQHEVLTGSELAERFPGYRLPPDIMAVLQPDGGYLAPERCIVSYAFEAMRHGAELHGRETVLGWEPLGDEGVRVETDRDVYEADSLVITAGAWNDRLIDFLPGLAVPERQVLAWFQPQRPELFEPELFPVFNLLVEEGRYYGFPVHGVPGFKIGRYHHFEEHGPADAIDFEVYEEDEEMLRELTSRYFPAAVGPTMTLKACMFTNTPDNHFLIDLHPQYPQVAYASACSGHGFKFASVVGEILADLAQHRATRHQIDLFSHERFLAGGRAGLPTETAVRRHARAGRGRPPDEEPAALHHASAAGRGRGHALAGHRQMAAGSRGRVPGGRGRWSRGGVAGGLGALRADDLLALGRGERLDRAQAWSDRESEQRRLDAEREVWSPWS